MFIEIDDLTVEFKNGYKGVDSLNLEIGDGIIGLLGENGAGKTTLMRVLTTILKPTKGVVRMNDILYKSENYYKIQRKIGYLPQELNLYPNLTVDECLMYLGQLSEMDKKLSRERVEYYLKKTSLVEHRKKKIKQLSGGMKRRVGLVQAMITEPEFLIVDEPTTGLDPEERVRIRKLLVDFSVGRTVLFSTHVVEDLAATTNKLAVMKKGKLIYSGIINNLLEKAKGYVWICEVKSEKEEMEIGKSFNIASKRFEDNKIILKIISEEKPMESVVESKVSLEDAYIVLNNFNL